MGCTNSKEDKSRSDGDDAKHDDGDLAEMEPKLRCDAPMEEPDDVDVDDEVNASDESSDSKYKLGGPNADGETKALWDPYAYKIVNDDGWFIYSDTNKYEVTFTFKTRSELEPGDVEFSEEDEKRVYKIKVYPGETKQLWQGAPNGWSYKASASGLSDEYLRAKAAEKEAGVQEAIAAVEGVAEEGDAEATLAACVEQGVPYVDLHFKPLSEHLGGSLPAATWMRPTEFLPEEMRSKIKPIRDGAEPNDIDQGRLGDCWFLCAVASVAEDAEKVKDMLRHPKRKLEIIKAERAVGAYRVTLNKHGWWHNLIMDDYLPTIGGTPCFGKNKEDPAELWVALVEKAFARLHGSYAAIAGGDARQALSDLTGYPCQSIDMENDQEEAHDQLVHYDGKGYMININTPGHDDSDYMGKSGAGNGKEFTERYKAAGLGMGHAYSILEAKHFPEKDDLRLVKIRNPWGNGTEWTGEWGDESPLWEENPDVKEACKFEPGADGTFWMAWKDACQYFDSCGVCFVERGWHDYRIKGTWTDARPSFIVEMKVTKPTEVYFVVSQKDKRGLADDDPDRKYHAPMISVCQRAEGSSRFTASRNSYWKRVDQPRSSYGYCTSRDVAMKVTLEPSDDPYLIVPRAHSSCKREKDFVLAVIASEAAGDGFEANFVKPADDWRCYQNYTKFSYSDEECERVTTEFQYNPEVGCPVTATGDKLESS